MVFKPDPKEFQKPFPITYLANPEKGRAVHAEVGKYNLGVFTLGYGTGASVLACSVGVWNGRTKTSKVEEREVMEIGLGDGLFMDGKKIVKGQSVTLPTNSSLVYTTKCVLMGLLGEFGLMYRAIGRAGIEAIGTEELGQFLKEVEQREFRYD